MKNLLVAFFVILLSGCVSIEANYKPKAKSIDWPALNETVTVYVGDKMLEQGNIYPTMALVINQKVEGMCYEIPAGKYKLRGESDSKFLFDPNGTNGPVMRTPMCDRIKGLFVSKNNLREVCLLSVLNGFSCFDIDVALEETDWMVMKSTQRTLLYSGKEGKQVKFTYVEQHRDNPPFSHNVSYNLAESNIISYRGARIQILKASHDQITYVVLKKFPPLSSTPE